MRTLALMFLITSCSVPDKHSPADAGIADAPADAPSGPI